MRDETERREFLAQALTLVSGCMCAGWVAGCETDVLKSSNVAVRFDVSSAPALAQVGGAVKQVFGGQLGGAPVVIIRQAEEEFLVLSSICTHQACEVNLPGEGDPQIWCECHDSLFERTSGRVLRGPATAPLPRFESTYDKGTETLTIQF
ncbi:MAG: Rieske (2Fe-2S) protein [Candidatus Latescibacteria bacterium]|jgi:Rieske Fe-S protein|nr:Rieske (2Fe-2S) protein [Candidatus Latescibacterota bacterium]